MTTPLKIKECAIEILEKLGYDIDETEPDIVASTIFLDINFSFYLDMFHLKFVLKDPLLIKNPHIERLMNVANKQFKQCLEL